MSIKRDITGVLAALETAERLARSVLAQAIEMPPPPSTPWSLPVGTPEHPARDWYVYTRHDLTGRRNPSRYQHTGIDINADWGGRGNVDIGEPVFAVTGGEVIDVGWSETYRGGFVLKVDHFGIPLYIRYWHLRGLQPLEIGNQIYPGRQMGKIDEYPGGYAHLHIDMAWQPFKHNWWWLYHPEIEWTNPVHILKCHIDPSQVDAMVSKSI